MTSHDLMAESDKMGTVCFQCFVRVTEGRQGRSFLLPCLLGQEAVTQRPGVITLGTLKSDEIWKHDDLFS